MFRASRDFIVLSLDGSRGVEDHPTDDQPATALSILDHYKGRPHSHFQDMTLLLYTQQFPVSSMVAAGCWMLNQREKGLPIHEFLKICFRRK